MNKFAITLGLLVSFHAQAGDNGYDQHFLASAALGAVGAILTEKTEHPVLCGVAIAMTFGIAKEAYDAKHPKNHTASGGDLAADLVGAVAGAYLGVSVKADRHHVRVGIEVPF